MATRRNATADAHSKTRAALWTGFILGIGLIGAVDEILFHQLLQWHHFYVHTDQFWRIASDGFFHIFTALMLFLGAMRLWSLRRRLSPVRSGRALWAGIFLGAGAFQFFDGTVNHKVLQIHPVREGVEHILPYDIGWMATALLLLAVGWFLWRGVRPEEVIVREEEEIVG